VSEVVTKKKTPRHSAFTLVELLVVVAIIAALIAMLLPSLRKAVDVAKMTNCANHLKQLMTAQRLYADENQDWVFMRGSYPPNTWPKGEGKFGHNGAWWSPLTYSGLLADGQRDILVCPSEFPFRFEGGSGARDRTYAVDRGSRYSRPKIEYQTIEVPLGSGSDTYLAPGEYFKMSQQPAPGRSFLYLDSTNFKGQFGGWIGWAADRPMAAARHFGKLQMGMLDTHVEAWTVDQMQAVSNQWVAVGTLGSYEQIPPWP
jgi:prepilin-type N-terminal cleavage/methylation domain-containing protein